MHISFSELQREQFPKYDPTYIDKLIKQLLTVGFDNCFLLEYTYLFGHYGIPSCLINDMKKLKEKVSENK